MWNAFPLSSVSLIILAIALMLVHGADSTATGAEGIRPRFSQSPRLATTSAEWEDETSRVDFPARREAAAQAAEPWIKHPIELPQGYGSWIFYYACEDDGSTLRMISLDEHHCPKCQRRYSDERTIAAYRCRMHYDLEQAAVKLGWACLYTGDDKYAAQVRRILMHLADAYDSYPARLDRWGWRGWFARLGGRRYVQSLDEAVGVIRLAKAYDLTRDSMVWTDEDRQHVEEDFFRATSRTLLAFNQGINNHQTWYNAGLMAIASVLADAELVDKVLTMRGGYRDQLQRSMGDDGLWYEGTMAYQNYALQAMVEIVDAGRRLGLELEKEPRFEKLLRSSLNVAYPNGQYPAINDSDPVSFRNFAWSYEWAWRVYGDPVFAQAVAWGKPQRLAEMLGPQAQPQWPLATTSLDLPDVGLAILRAGKPENGTCVFFDYGQHGGGHGHYDKLNITLFANDREWLLDTGRIGYTHKEYQTWVKHTVAHNTVVVNQADQWPTTGNLLWLQTNPRWNACCGESELAYPGVTLRRYLLLTPKLLVDVYDVSSPNPIQVDWLAHAVTKPVEAVVACDATDVTSLGTGSGYEHLVDIRRWQVDGPSRWDFPDGNTRLRCWLDGDAIDEIYTCIGIGSQVGQQAPTILRRRHDVRDARFVTVYDLSGDGGYVTQVKLRPTKQPSVVVHSIDGKMQITFDQHRAEVR